MFNITLLKVLNFIKPFIIYIIFGLILLFLYNKNNKLSEDIKRYGNNYQALVQNSAIQQELTRSQYKEFYANKEDSLLKLLNIKQKNVVNIVKIKYNYIDTFVTHIQFDTVKVKIVGEETFNIPKECYIIKGKINKDGVYINSIKNIDNLTYFLYKSYHKKFLCFKWQPYYEAKVYSECKKDTMVIETNLKIQE